MWRFIKWIFRIIAIVLSFLFSSSTVTAEETSKREFEKEDFYNILYCEKLGGEFNKYHRVIGATSAKVDCETDDTVYEGEWATKSYEAVGQSLWNMLLLNW